MTCFYYIITFKFAKTILSSDKAFYQHLLYSVRLPLKCQNAHF